MCDCWPLHGLEKGQVIKDGWMDGGWMVFHKNVALNYFFLSIRTHYRPLPT